MAPVTRKNKRSTKDVTFVSTEDDPLTKKRCTCTCTNKVSSKSNEPMTRRAPIKSKAPVIPRTPRSNKHQMPLVPEPRTPITRSKKKQLLSVQEQNTLNVLQNRQNPPFARKWSNNDELRILRGLQEHRQLHGNLPNLAVLYEKIMRDGSFDNQDAGIPKFKDKVHKLLRLYKKMVSMKEPMRDSHKIELFGIACNVWGDNASNAYPHAPAAPLAAHAGTGASLDALAAGVTGGMPLPVKRAVSSLAVLTCAYPAALACASPAAPARGSPAAPAHTMLLPCGTTSSSSCANDRDKDKLSQWLHVVLRWGSRVAFLVAFASFMSLGWRKGGHKELMELGDLLP